MDAAVFQGPQLQPSLCPSRGHRPCPFVFFLFLTAYWLTVPFTPFKRTVTGFRTGSGTCSRQVVTFRTHLPRPGHGCTRSVPGDLSEGSGTVHLLHLAHPGGDGFTVHPRCCMCQDVLPRDRRPWCVYPFILSGAHGPPSLFGDGKGTATPLGEFPAGPITSSLRDGPRGEELWVRGLLGVHLRNCHPGEASCSPPGPRPSSRPSDGRRLTRSPTRSPALPPARHRGAWCAPRGSAGLCPFPLLSLGLQSMLSELLP